MATVGARPAPDNLGGKGMLGLALAAAGFAGLHLLVSTTPLRRVLVNSVGEGPYLAGYSLMSAITLVWLIRAYGAVPHTEYLWVPHVGVKHALLTLMPIPLWLVVASLLRRNPTSVGQSVDDPAQNARGVLAITRHPFLWGASLWAALHILANGDVASLLFFGSFLVLSLLGTVSIDARRRRDDPGFEAYAARTSNVPFVALAGGRAATGLRDFGILPLAVAALVYGTLLFVHPLLFGVAVLPG